MTTEDGCVKREDLEATRELMQHQIEAVEELVQTKIEALKELVEKNEREAAARLDGLRREADQRRTEFVTRIDGLRTEMAARIDSHDTQIQTLRAGRSEDKGWRLGQEPWLKLVLTVVAAILAAALIAFFAGRGSNSPQPAQTGAHP